MTEASRTLSAHIQYRIFVIALWITQGVILYNMLNHTSTGGAISGRYSQGYMLAIIGFSLLALMWLPILYFRVKIRDWIAPLPAGGILLVLAVAGVSTWGFWLFLSVEVQILFAISTNWFLIAAFVLLCMPDARTASSKRYIWIVLGSGLVLLPMIFITMMSEMQFSPDEAIWADLASTFSVTGKLYPRIIYRPSYEIVPGVGWFNLIYTFSLEYIVFDIRTGRFLNFLNYLLTIGGVGINASLLYGRWAGGLSALVAFLGLSFFPTVDYRADYFIASASMLVVYCAIKGYQATRYAFFWHFLCGLFATLTLQIHASGIVYAAGFSLLYSAAFIYQSYRKHRIHNIRSVLAFAGGAAIGTGIYMVFNIMPVGGVGNFLDILFFERFSESGTFRNLVYLSFYLPDMLLIVMSFLLLFWRRSSKDRFYLAMMVSLIIAIMILDTQGYFVGYRPIFYLPVGWTILTIFQDVSLSSTMTRRGLAILCFVIILMVGPALLFSINLQYVQYVLTEGELPSHEIMSINDEIVGRVEDDTVVVSTHELIWGFQYRDDFYGTIAEGTVVATRQYTDALDFWRDIAPDLIIEIEQRTVLPPRLLVYMDEEAFQTCEIFDAAGYEVTFHRRNCPATITVD